MGVGARLKNGYEIYMHGRHWRQRQRLWNGRLSEYTQHVSGRFSRAEIDAFQKMWSNTGVSADYRWAEYYSDKSGICSVNYMPDDIYYTHIDEHYNDWGAVSVFDDKNYYDLLFRGFPRPKTILRKVNGQWALPDWTPIDEDGAVAEIVKHEEAVVKASRDSEGGAGVSFVSGNASKVEACIAGTPEDAVVEEVIRQHPDMQRLNESSVNTVRILSLKHKGKIIPLSSIVRMGVGEMRVDNASSGGVTCGIDERGRMKRYIHSATYKGECHPTTLQCFEGLQVPYYDDCLELVKSAQLRIPRFNLVSWDIAIGQEGPLLLEANMHYGELDFHQWNNGPVFGSLTESVLKEVFG